MQDRSGYGGTWSSWHSSDSAAAGAASTPQHVAVATRAGGPADCSGLKTATIGDCVPHGSLIAAAAVTLYGSGVGDADTESRSVGKTSCASGAASRVSRFAEVVPQADVAAVRSRSMTLSGDPDAAAAGGSSKDGGSTAGVHVIAAASTGGAVAAAEPLPEPQPDTEFLAMFHLPTDLGTLAETDGWKTEVPGTAVAPQRPGEGAPMKERLAYIAAQLDTFGPRGMLLDRYEMLGGDDRCRGGAVHTAMHACALRAIIGRVHDAANAHCTRPCCRCSAWDA